MATQTAIAYGGRRVRLLEFDGSARKLRVLGVRDVSLDVPPATEGGPDPDDVRATAIAGSMSEAGFVKDPSGMSFDAGHAMFREFDLPFTNEEQIGKVVRFESEGHFPGDIDDLIIQHLVLRRLRDKSHLLVVGVRKDDLLDRLDIIDEAGLDPQFVDIDVFSMYHALVGTEVAGEHARSVVVNASESATTLMFLVDGSLFAVRSIRIGTHGVSAEGVEPADGAAREGGAREVSAVVRDGAAAREADIETARTHDYLARLTREVRRTLSTLPDFGKAEALHVTGAGCRLPGFAEAMSAAFAVPAQPLALLDRVDHKLSAEEVARYGDDIGDALGVAYKLCGLDLTRTDFRRGEAAYTRKFDQVKTSLIVLALMVFLATAFVGLHAFMEVKKLKAEYGTGDGSAQDEASITGTGMRQLKELLLDDEEAFAAARARIASGEFGPQRVQALVGEVRKLSEDMKQKLGRSTTIPELPSALAAWIELFNVIRDHEDEIGRLALSRVDIEAAGRNPVIRITGETEDLTKLSRLVDLIKERPMFPDATIGSTKPTSKGTLSFTDVTITLNLAGTDETGEARS